MQKYSNLTLVVHCSKRPSNDKIEAYEALCEQIIFIDNEISNFASSEKFSVILQADEEGKVAALNTAIQKARGSHILWMHDDETIPELPKLHKNTYYVARVKRGNNQTPIKSWQIRLLPNQYSAERLMQGFEIPDIYSTAQRLKWQQSKNVLNIESKGLLFPPEAIQKELGKGSSTMHAFWLGMMRTEEKKFSKAISCFKAVLKQRELAPWNGLAVLNSLANAYMEKHKLYEAHKTAKKSLKISVNQRAPHLTLYQYYNLKGEHKKAYQTLKKYLQTTEVSTKANWDVFLPKAQAIFLMAETALYLGRHERAFEHYKQFFDHHNGNISDAIIEKLLIYSIELGNREKAIQYFNALFVADLPEVRDKNRIARVKEVLALFADKNWYKFINKIYEQLVAHHPKDEDLRNGWIRMLVKNDEIKRARALI